MNFDNIEKSVTEIRSSLYDLATVLNNIPGGNQDSVDFNAQNRELLIENRHLKEKVIGLEGQLEEKNLRIKILEKLVLETHL